MRKKRDSLQRERPHRDISIKRFALIYLLLMGAFFFMIGFTPFQKIIDINGGYTKGVVLVTSKILDVMGIPSDYHGSIIKLPAITLDVKFGCNGLEAVMIYAVAVIAFPATWKRKLIGIFGGFVIIQVLNILRIAGLAYSGVHLHKLFEVMHIYVAQGIMIAVALGIFLLYLYYVGKPEKKTV